MSPLLKLDELSVIDCEVTPPIEIPFLYHAHVLAEIFSMSLSMSLKPPATQRIVEEVVGLVLLSVGEDRVALCGSG